MLTEDRMLNLEKYRSEIFSRKFDVTNIDGQYGMTRSQPRQTLRCYTDAVYRPKNIILEPMNK